MMRFFYHPLLWVMAAATKQTRRLNLEIGNFLLLAIHLAEAKHFVLLVIFCLYSLQTHIHSDTQTD